MPGKTKTKLKGQIMSEIKIPVISESTGLSSEQALAEYLEMSNAPVPRFGWCFGVQEKINCRLNYLKTVVFDHAMEIYKKETNND